MENKKDIQTILNELKEQIGDTHKIFIIDKEAELINEVSQDTIAIKHKEICEKIMETYQRKNHDYGDTFNKTYADYGLLAPLVRYRDKLGRAENLLKVGKNLVTDESIQDTILDLANYCIMTYATMECIKDYKNSI